MQTRVPSKWAFTFYDGQKNSLATFPGSSQHQTRRAWRSGAWSVIASVAAGSGGGLGELGQPLSTRSFSAALGAPPARKSVETGPALRGVIARVKERVPWCVHRGRSAASISSDFEDVATRRASFCAPLMAALSLPTRVAVLSHRGRRSPELRWPRLGVWAI